MSARRTGRDDGSVLTMTLVMVVVGSLIIGGLLTFTSTVLRARPPLEERTTAAESARSAIRFAIHQQRIAGPEACYQGSQTVAINGVSAQVSCTASVESYENALLRNRYGLITTSTDPAVAPILGSGPAGPTIDVSGSVFVNAGHVGATDESKIRVTGEVAGSRVDHDANPATLNYALGPAAAPVPADCDTVQAQSPASMTCVDTDWQSSAGYSADGTTFVYPPLPPVPGTTRPGSKFPLNFATASNCKVFYPGYYPDPVNITGGVAYFASGVYYFEQPVKISGGARVVAGVGKYQGCVIDSDAALYTDPGGSEAKSAPKNHGITGFGATFILGRAGRLEVTQASLLMNRRVSTPDTRMSEGISVRTVNTTARTAATDKVKYPADRVYVSEAVPSAPATTPNNGIVYDGSDLVWNQLGIDVNINGSTASNPYEVRFDGAVFMPNTGFNVDADTTSYAFQVTSGLTASTVRLDLDQLPANSANFYVGARDTARQTEFTFTAEVVSPSGRHTESVAVMQLNQNGSYGVNTWTLDV